MIRIILASSAANLLVVAFVLDQSPVLRKSPDVKDGTFWVNHMIAADSLSKRWMWIASRCGMQATR
jgi:hypothetical protein